MASRTSEHKHKSRNTMFHDSITSCSWLSLHITSDLNICRCCGFRIHGSMARHTRIDKDASERVRTSRDNGNKQSVISPQAHLSMPTTRQNRIHVTSFQTQEMLWEGDAQHFCRSAHMMREGSLSDAWSIEMDGRLGSISRRVVVAG